MERLLNLRLALSGLLLLTLLGCSDGGDDKKRAPAVAAVELINLTGAVYDEETRSPLPGTAVVAWARLEEGEDLAPVSETQTGTNGAYQLAVDSNYLMVVVEVRHPGFRSAYQRLSASDAPPDSPLPPVYLAEAETVWNFDANDLAVFSEDRIEVEVQPDYLVNTAGEIHVGEASASIGLFDLSADPASLSGTYTYLDLNSGRLYDLAAFAAVDIRFRNELGEILSLDTNRRFTVRIPLPDTSQMKGAPETVQMNIFDPALGYWVDARIRGTLITEEDGSKAYFARLDRPGLWLAGQPITNTVPVRGCVVHEGQRVANSLVTASGVYFASRVSTLTDETGYFEMQLQRNAFLQLAAGYEPTESTEVLTGLYGQDMEACLTLTGALTGPETPVITNPPPEEGEGSEVVNYSAEVLNFETGIPLAGITVTVQSTDAGTEAASYSAVTDAQGRFVMALPANLRDFIVAVNHPDYRPFYQRLPSVASLLAIRLNPLILPVDIQESPDSANPALISGVGGAVLVSIGADTLQRPDGSPFSGVYRAVVSVIDPSSNSGELPGGYLLLDPLNGSTFNLSSLGALDLRLLDSAGNFLTLVPGETLSLQIPLASQVSADTVPQQVELFFFDVLLGFWVESEVMATLTEISSGVFAYVAEINRPGLWMAGEVIGRDALVEGCVVDAQGNPVSDAIVRADGRRFIAQHEVFSDEQGDFQVLVNANSEYLLTATRGAQTEVRVIDSGLGLTLDSCLVLSETGVSVKLTWGLEPRDLDATLLVEQEGALSAVVNFQNQQLELDGTLINLDVDDLTSFGPEVMTLSGLLPNTDYHYVVHQFSAESQVAQESTRVQVNFRGELYAYRGSDATGDDRAQRWLHVFSIRVDQSGNAEYLPANRLLGSREEVLGFTASPAPPQPVVQP